MSIAGPTDYLALGGLILARLESRLPDLSGRIKSLGDPAAIDAAGQVTPALFVLFGGETVESDRSGRAESVIQTWMVVVSVRSHQDMRSGQSAYAIAGPIVTRVIHALSGWHPGSPYGLLTRVTPSLGPGYENGWYYHPLAWECRFAFSASSLEIPQ